ncbi:MAG: aldo/keto reductase, partial [Halanaerobium sp.]
AYGDDTFGEVDDRQSIRAIKAAVDSGINLIDTAPAYGAGHAEKVVGQAIEGIRDKVVIATKCGVHREGQKYVNDLTPKRIRKEIEDSLRRLNIEQIDLYQIHWPDPDTPLKDSVEELLKLKKEGKFKYLGVSNFGVDLMNQITEMTDIISLQPHYSLLRRDIEAEILPYLRENNLGSLTYGTLGGGILSAKYKQRPEFDEEKDNRDGFYPFFKKENWPQTQSLISLLEDIADKYRQTPAQIAINWAIKRPGITTALVGAKNEKQAAENAAAADFDLREEDMSALTQESDKVIKNLKV